MVPTPFAVPRHLRRLIIRSFHVAIGPHRLSLGTVKRRSHHAVSVESRQSVIFASTSRTLSRFMPTALCNWAGSGSDVFSRRLRW